jgi:hypothetical protein
MGDNDKPTSSRIRLIRETAVFQIKLLADGFRDALLIPISLIAAAVGFLRGGDEPDREFRRVLELGRQTERWINLFGRHSDVDIENHVGTIDQVLEQAEAVVVEQYRKGRPKANGDRPDEAPDTADSDTKKLSEDRPGRAPGGSQ